MSDLQPKGVAIEVGGAERHLLFTIAVVDELQSKYNMPISQVMSLLSDAMQSPNVVADIMLALINDEIRRNRHYHHSDEKEIPEEEGKWLVEMPRFDEFMGAILLAYMGSIPEADEDEDPNVESRSD